MGVVEEVVKTKCEIVDQKTKETVQILWVSTMKDWNCLAPPLKGSRGRTFSLYAAKRKCCMWLVNKVEMYFSKMGGMDSKWPNLIALCEYSLWCHSILGFTVGCPFLCMQGKENYARGS